MPWRLRAWPCRPAVGMPPPGGPVPKAKGKAKAKAHQPLLPIAAFPGAAPGVPMIPYGLQVVAQPAGAGRGAVWTNFVNNPVALARLQLKGGDFLEIAMADNSGAAWAATAVFQIRQLDPQDQAGQFALVDFVGASDPG